MYPLRLFLHQKKRINLRLILKLLIWSEISEISYIGKNEPFKTPVKRGI